jgi:GTP-binding protein EngB required for normal cell division
MAIHGLTENHERGLLASIQYALKLIRDCEEILASADHPNPLTRYVGGLAAPQRRIAEDYLQRLRQQIIRFLDVAQIAPPEPRVTAVHAIQTLMIFIEDALEEMRARHLRGFGAVSAEAERLLDGEVSAMQAHVREIETFLTGATADVLRSQLDSLPSDDPMAADLRELERIITAHRLVDLRASLTLVVDRARDTAFEVAVIGRVSSGKSSLLNALLGAPVLPTGVLPMTSVPTRLRRGPVATAHLTYAHGRTVSYGIDRLTDFVTESHNPGNEKRVARVLVEYPSEVLPDGVVFVDTPGLGSVASRGALQTFAYLPRCDHAAFLFDATAPLTEEDLGLLGFLREAGITTSVLLSKADLLTPADLERVREYVSSEIRRRVNAPIQVRSISVMPSHAGLLRAWIADEVTPLGAEAVTRRRQALARKIDILRAQAAAMLQGAKRSPRTISTADTDIIVGRLRDTSAALERATRDVWAISDRRQMLLDRTLASAGEIVYTQLRADAGLNTSEAMADALERPAHQEAERVARDLDQLATEVRAALSDAASASGIALGSLDAFVGPREVPLLSVPQLSWQARPPAWARVSTGLLRRWVNDKLRELWAPALERSLWSYVDVLKRWAADRITRMQEEFDSVTRPLLAQLSPAARLSVETDPDAAHIDSDLRWLRHGNEPQERTRRQSFSTRR